METNENIDIMSKIDEYEKEITKLEKKMIHPLAADFVFALITSIILNTVANITDKYSLMEYLKYVTYDTIGFMPVGSIISFFVHELNEEKKEKLVELFDKVNELKMKINNNEMYEYDYSKKLIKH